MAGFFFLDSITSATARTRLLVMGAVFGAALLYMRHHVASLSRPDFRGQPFIEDTPSGTGTRYWVVSRGSASGGASAELGLLIRADAPGLYAGFAGSSAFHSHPEQEEALAVVAGSLGYNLGGRIGTAAAGETLVVPQGVPHSTWNAGGGDLELRLTLSPAGRMGERFYEVLAGLGATYGSVAAIHPLQLVVLFEEAGVKLEGVPGAFSWALSNLLAPLARDLLGFRAAYAEYVTAPAAAAPREQQVPDE